MAGKVKPIPEGYRTVTPILSLKGAAEALEFYKKAFDAKELMRFPQPDGRIGHAEIQIGDSRIMMADEFPEMNFKSPKSYGGSPVGIMLYVENVDAFVERAVTAGAKLGRPVQSQFYEVEPVVLEIRLVILGQVPPTIEKGHLIDFVSRAAGRPSHGRGSSA